jgi:hypothetical protein
MAVAGSSGTVKLKFANAWPRRMYAADAEGEIRILTVLPEELMLDPPAGGGVVSVRPVNGLAA